MGAPRYKFKYKQNVRVRVRRGGGQPHFWAPGWVKDLHGKGASVQVTDEHGKQLYSDFFHWSDIREPEEAEAAPTKPIATLGDKLGRAIAAKAIPLAPPPPAPPPPAPPPPAVTPAPSPPPAAAAPDRILITREELDRMTAERKTPSSTNNPLPPKAPDSSRGFVRRRLNPDTTRIGRRVREAREVKNLSQMDVLDHLWRGKHTRSVSNTRMSAIETGRAIPNDDELLAFSEILGVDLGELETLRDQDLQNPRPTTSVQPANTTLRALPPPEPEDEQDDDDLDDTANDESESSVMVAAAQQTPPPGADAVTAYNEFVDQLDSVVPLPADREKRKLWLAMAAKFYELKRG